MIIILIMEMFATSYFQKIIKIATKYDENEALYFAKCDAYIKFKEKIEGAVVAKQTERDIRQKGLDAVLDADQRKKNEVCSCIQLSIKGDMVTAYVLYEYQTDARYGCTFENFDCDKYNKNLKNSLYINFGDGITYGIFGMSFGGRHGGIVGFGYQFGVGIGVGANYIHYSGSLKFYPYKWFFISANYGTIGIGKSISTNTDDGHFNYRSNYIQHGLTLLGGADINLGRIGVLNIAIGTTRLDKNQWRFAWDGGIGFAFNF